jgi:hypothetical protein
MIVMAHASSRTRYASLRKVFAAGKSTLLDGLARMSVLYEDLRIETFALTADDEEVKRLDYLDKRYRVHYFLRRSMVTLLEFRSALLRLSQTAEYKEEKAITVYPDAPTVKKVNRDLFLIVDAALTFFDVNHALLKGLRNAVGGHFSEAAAQAATANLETDASSKLEVTFDKTRRGGGAKLHYAGEIAATAFTRNLPRLKPRSEEVSDAIRMIRDGYAYATRSMHALIILFLWDRFV